MLEPVTLPPSVDTVTVPLGEDAADEVDETDGDDGDGEEDDDKGDDDCTLGLCEGEEMNSCDHMHDLASNLSNTPFGRKPSLCKESRERVCSVDRALYGVKWK